MPQVTRRSLLLAGAGGLAVLALGSGTTAYGRDRALGTAASRAFSTAGTTLEQVATPSGAGGYRRLAEGPGYPLAVRHELCRGKSGRDSTRTALASIVQLTDLHIIDAQSPMRFEFLLDVDKTAFRPHEPLGTHGAAQLVERVNRLGAGPFTGRAFDCVVSTGDNSDNNETIELDWFLAVMNGGSITANTGSATEWEGVQNAGDALFYNPELSTRDRYKKAGFPQIESYFTRVMRQHSSPGLATPWFSVFGNHDDSIGGTVPAGWHPLEELYTGGTKFTGFTSDSANKAVKDAFATRSSAGLGRDVRLKKHWQVTPDERRRPFSPGDFIAAHRAPSATGPGPLGHGFTAESLAYYSFSIAPGITGIAMDSTNRAGFTHGSLDARQFAWLEATLKAGTSRYYDVTGNAVMHAVDDHYFVLFSHHTSTTMDNPLPDPDDVDQRRHLGRDVVELIKRYPNVLAWVNGHTHSNAITAHAGATPRQGFWEINTASHIEFPQQARVVDVCDNRDGSLSLFTTLIESAAPYRASYTDGSQAALASMYREFSANDLYYSARHAGTASDRNTELLLADPLA